MEKIKSAEEFFRFCEKHEIEFVDFRYTQLNGRMDHLSYRLSELDGKTLREGIVFDASKVSGWQKTSEADLLLIPDLSTTLLDPFYTDPTAIVLCDVYDPRGQTPYAKCPRSVAKAAAAQIIKDADDVIMATSSDFYLLDQARFAANMSFYDFQGCELADTLPVGADAYSSSHRPRPLEGTLQLPPVDSSQDIRAEILQVLKNLGIDAFSHVHGASVSQATIGLHFAGLVGSADALNSFKYVARNVAELNGKSASFAPFLLPGRGNSTCINVSLQKGKKNIFYDESDALGLSKTAKSFAAGVFAHAKSLCAFTNATINSYTRLANDAALADLKMQAGSRAAAIRVPLRLNNKNARLVLLFPDSSANPYLALSAILLAGIDGIKKGLEISPEPSALPRSLRASLEALELDNEYLKPAFSPDLINAYIDEKLRSQVLFDECIPSVHEMQSAYSC